MIKAKKILLTILKCIRKNGSHAVQRIYPLKLGPKRYNKFKLHLMQMLKKSYTCRLIHLRNLKLHTTRCSKSLIINRFKGTNLNVITHFLQRQK